MKLIKIGAIWCSGCLVMNKVWNKLIKEYIKNTIIDTHTKLFKIKKFFSKKLFIFHKICAII